MVFRATPLPHEFLVLLVHPESGVRFAVADFLRQRGFQVDEARDPGEAWARLAALTYQVLITDYHFARRSGEGLTLAGRARALLPTPVVCLLAPPLEPDEAELAARDTDLLVVGPRPLPDLAQMLFALLQDRAAVTLPSHS